MADQVLVIAIDVSPDALQLARENAVGHGVADRMVFVAADLLPYHVEPPYAVVCANLPYVPTDELPALAARARVRAALGARRRPGRPRRRPAPARPAARRSPRPTGSRCWRSARTRATRSRARSPSGCPAPGAPSCPTSPAARGSSGSSSSPA